MTDELLVLGTQKGMLVVATSVARFRAGHVLECGELRTAFRPAPAPARLLAGTNLLLEPTGLGASGWQVEGEATLVVNTNPEFAVRDTDSVILAVARDVSATVRYRDAEFADLIPVTAGEYYEFTGLFASHGAQGSVRLTLHDASGSCIATEEAPLSAHYAGGVRRGDYQRVVLGLRAPAEAVAARVEIACAGAVEGLASEQASVFVLFLDAELRSRGPGFQAADPDGIRLLLRMLGDAGAERSLFWAPVDARAGGEVKELHVTRVGDPDGPPAASYRLPDLSGSEVQMGRQRGNLLYTRVRGYSGTLQLFLDGTPILSRKIGSSEKGRRIDWIIPSESCDGLVHEIEVRDATGLRVLAATTLTLPAYPPNTWPYLQALHPKPPVPFELAPAAGRRYRTLQDRLNLITATGGSVAEEVAALSHVHEVVANGFETLTEFGRLRFPHVEDPVVSVVVPVHNKFNVTYFCLAALLFAINDTPFEVVVVDDGSSDETLRIAEHVEAVTVARHEEAQGFIRACNLGVSRARGEYVVLLNNDTEPTSGWLDALVAGFGHFDAVGMTGSQLLYPNGRLQEAGGIVWGNGNPWNYGRNENPIDPRYNYARQADYLSGAAVMLPRTVWDEVGGLSEEFVPAYFEDTDLAFKVREAGYTTWYVPSSKVYHHEGISNGTDVADESSMKRFQEINRPKFKRKWRERFSAHRAEGVDPELEKDRGIIGRILFVDITVPTPDQDAGSYAAVQEMRLVQSLGYKVTFAPMNMLYAGRYTDELAAMGVETLHSPFYRSVREVLERRGTEFDAVFITRYAVANKVIDAVRAHAPRAKVLFNNADLHFLRELRMAAVLQTDEQWERVVEVREAELAAMGRVDVILSYSEVEHEVIRSHNLGGTPVTTCPWVVQARDLDDVPPYDARDGIAFLGGYNHPPNVQAVEFFVGEVLPLLRERLPGVPFRIYGSAMPDSIRDLADDVVRPVGFVDTVAEIYDTNRVFVAPLLSGAGIKGKVIGAMADGIPVVLSPVAAEGTGVRDGYDAQVAASVEEWVEKVTALYGDRTAWETQSRNALQLTSDRYSFATGREQMRQAFGIVGLATAEPHGIPPLGADAVHA